MNPPPPQSTASGSRMPDSAIRRSGGFTIVELLVSMLVLVIILSVIFLIIQQTGNAWRSTNSKIETFQRARAAFETLTSTLGQATLNTYYDYYAANGDRRTNANASTFVPFKYGRYSDLHFISGKSLVPSQSGHAIFFQTPAGYSDNSTYQDMDTLLNACGYYVVYDKDPTLPDFLSAIPNKPADRYRFRLMQFLQPSQNLAIYDTSGTGNNWFSAPIATGSSAPVRLIADNLLALVLIPKNPQGVNLTTDFEYDSHDTHNWSPASNSQQPATNNQLPPLVEVVMVFIDETSAQRFCTTSTPPGFGVQDLFKDSTGSKIDDDLKTLESTLIGKHINYRIFRTIVTLRNAKWSS